MKIRAVILAGGEGSRLGVLTAKRTKPAVPFAGKYRIIDFTLSNCVNSNIFDVMILTQYRPHSLIEHIGAGGPWDLNRDFTGGVRIYSPYKARGASDWYMGTADAVQQNFLFVKSTKPDLILILSGDHIYTMDYRKMIQFHLDKGSELTMAAIRVPLSEASRFGIIAVDENLRITDFIEKPENPPSDLVNMGVYLFNRDLLDHALWEDHNRPDSSHDFGKDILPRLVAKGHAVHAYPYDSYWVDVGTSVSYWQAHMDMLVDNPAINLHDRNWIIHTRTEERPPAWISQNAQIANSMICDGCTIGSGALVERSVLGPGVIVEPGAQIRESILLTDVVVESGAQVLRAILDKRSRVGSQAVVGKMEDSPPTALPMAGKHAIIPPGLVMEPGAILGPDVIPSDIDVQIVRSKQYINTRRLPNEL